MLALDRLAAGTALLAGANLGLVWEAPNWAFAGVLLALGVTVLRRSQVRSRVRAR